MEKEAIKKKIYEKRYCECKENHFNIIDDNPNFMGECPRCHKPHYSHWWASEMNKKTASEISPDELNPDTEGCEDNSRDN